MSKRALRAAAAIPAACLLFSALCLPAPADESKPKETAKPKESIEVLPIEVRIAIPVHHGKRSLNEYDHFHVLLTNRSESTLRLWTDRYSWGYDNLSFEIIAADGRSTKVAKKARGWDKNFPDWLELAPGESYVLNVNLMDAKVWDNMLPRPAAGAAPALVKLRAIYEVAPDEESANLGVWAGKAVSAAAEYAVW